MTLQLLPAEGIWDVALICPEFSADCLETLEEIDVENWEGFMPAGGHTYIYVPALNDSPVHIQFLAESRL
ncbi:MAG: hypothetical protein HKN13_10835 [Rhodothermales bacterium]|nr:hypothetical protein [Rhodothermales bacterium]